MSDYEYGRYDDDYDYYDSDDYDYDYCDSDDYDDYDYYDVTPRAPRRTINETNRKGIYLKPFDWDSSALSRFYNKEEQRSTFSDITVKVQTQIYHLDKTILALQSAYFETLFTSDFEDRNYDTIEIHTIDEDTFSSIVDCMYGADLDDGVINKHNFAALFMAMDYLQMEINLKIFARFLTQTHELDITAVFQLHNYVSLLPGFKAITTAIYQHFAINLRTIRSTSEFLSMASIALISEALNAHTYNGYDCDDDDDHVLVKNHFFIEICVEWICYDFQKRLPHIVDLVNALKRKLGFSFAISYANYEAFEEPDERKQKTRVRKYFDRLLNHSTETRPEPAKTEISEKNMLQYTREMSQYTSVHKIDHASKWKTYLEQDNFCDVTIRAGDEIFKLHRVQLSLEIPYIHNLLIQSPNQNEFVLEAPIDGAAFREIVNFIYYKEMNLTNQNHLIGLLQSCAMLQIDGLKRDIYNHIRSNLDSMKNIVIKFLSFTIENEEFYEHLDELEAFIGIKWEELCTAPGFNETSIDVLEHVVTLPNLQIKNEHSLLNICSQWIYFDVKNRYQFIPKLALAINRSSEVAFEKYSSAQHEDLCSAEQIEEQLTNILSSTQLVSTHSSHLGRDLAEELRPCFAVLKDKEVSIVNGQFDEIISIPLLHPVAEDGIQELSAAIVKDDVFVLYAFAEGKKFSFQVYNICSKKGTSLTFTCNKNPSDFRLINRNDELYFGAHVEDYIWKYSFLLNRWIRLFRNEGEAKYYYLITSDGNILYRLFESEVQQYEFDKQSWVKFKCLPFETDYGYYVDDLSINNENFAILFDRCTAIYQQKSQEWKLIMHDDKQFATFKHFKDSILYIRHEKDSIELHSFSTVDNQWQLQKKVQMEYNKIVQIHSVNVGNVKSTM